MPSFETFHKSMSALARDPAVTVHKSRVLSLNGSAYVALGSPAAVELLFDRDSQTIGLLPADPTKAHCSFIRRAAPGANGPFLISAMAFIRHYGIVCVETLRWPADVIEGVLCVRLTSPAFPTSKNAGRRAAPKLSIVPDVANDARSLWEANG